MKIDYAEKFNRDARLVVLKELNIQNNGSLNETILTDVLTTFGYNRSRDWLRTQLRAMEEIGAIRVVEAGSVLVASITHAGVDHLERRSFIEGIDRPRLGD